MKKCAKCGEEKALEAFPQKKGRPQSPCRACNSARNAEYNRQHKEQHAAAVKKWTAKQSPAWQAVERAKRNAYKKDNREKMRGYNKAWGRAHPDRVKANNRKQHAKRAGAPSTNAASYTRVLQNDPCAYCGGSMRHIDHIDPVAEGGTHDWQNLTAACQRCNQQKHRKPLLLFLLDRAA